MSDETKAFWIGMGYPVGCAAGCGLLIVLLFAGCTGIAVVGSFIGQ